MGCQIYNMGSKDIQQINDISIIKSELENVVKNMIHVSIISDDIRGREVLNYYISILGHKVKYHQLSARGYELAKDKEYSFLGKYDESVEKCMKKFRVWDKPLERNFNKLKHRMNKRVKENK